MRANQHIKCTIILLATVLAGCQFKSATTRTEEPTDLPPIKAPESVVTDSEKPEPVEPKSIEPKPVEPKPAEPKPAEPKPAEPKPAEPKPAEPKPAEPKPAKPKPAEPKPMEPPRAQVLTLAGRIALDQSKLKHKNAEIQDTIVYFEPMNTQFSTLPTTNAVISTQNKQFKPNVLAITAGSEVSFPNMDRILHNVFSVSPESEFDLGLYSAGTSKTVTFEEAGVIYVHCNVHHSMQADILVLDTPYFTQVDDQGNFELTDLPELSGTLKMWHPRGNIKSLQINGNMNHQRINQTVEITRPEVPKHRNKFGNTYRRKRY